MDWQISVSVLLSIGGIVASVASSIAFVRAKLNNLEKEFDGICKDNEELRMRFFEHISENSAKIAVLEKNQQNHDKELGEMRVDIKELLSSVQEIKEAVIKKGDL